MATLDSTDWGEADPDAQLEHPGCHLTTGMFADLFGRVAGATVAVLEVECRSSGAPRCRFLVANPELLEQVYEGMSNGATHEEAIATVSAPA
ncbi:MAG: 4-vinyl reductase [Gemmatimonadaceae bacterium]